MTSFFNFCGGNPSASSLLYKTQPAVAQRFSPMTTIKSCVADKKERRKNDVLSTVFVGSIFDVCDQHSLSITTLPLECLIVNRNHQLFV